MPLFPSIIRPFLAAAPVAALSSFALGCSASHASRPLAVFPAQDALEKLPSLPAPPEAFSFDAAPVEVWSYQAAEEPASHDADASAWSNLARSIAAAHAASVRVSPEMRCVAAAIARFYVEKQGAPNESLRRFTAARCGSTSPETVPLLYTGETSGAVADAAIFDKYHAPVRGLIERQLSGDGSSLLGIDTYRSGGHFAIAAVLGKEEVTLDPAPRTIDDSRRIVVRGMLRVSAAETSAYINRGD